MNSTPLKACAAAASLVAGLTIASAPNAQIHTHKGGAPIIFNSNNANNFYPADVNVPFKNLVKNAAEDPTAPIYEGIEDAADHANGKLVVINDWSNDLSGFSLGPFGNKMNGVNQAWSAARSSGLTAFLVSFSGYRSFPQKPPPGNLLPGSYYVLTLQPISFADETPQNVVDSLNRQISADSPQGTGGGRRREYNDYIAYLFKIAKTYDYKTLSGPCGTAIKGSATNIALIGLAGQCMEIMAQNDAIASQDKFVRWAKYHPMSKVRLAAFKALIAINRQDLADDILKTEPNEEVRDAVSKLML